MANETIDVVISFDTTGSMSGYLNQVRTDSKAVVERLFGVIPELRMGVMAHGDYEDAKRTYLLKKRDLTANRDAILKFIKTTRGTAGGDAPEAYEYMLREAKGLKWREGSARVLVVIGDEIPHNTTYRGNKDHIDWKKELADLVNLGVKIYAVHVGGAKRSKRFYATLATKSGGTYLTLDQLKNVSDLLTGIALRERSEEHLAEYAAEVHRDRGMDPSLRTAYEVMLGRALTEAEGGDASGAKPAKEARAKRPVAKKKPAARKVAKN